MNNQIARTHALCANTRGVRRANLLPHTVGDRGWQRRRSAAQHRRQVRGYRCGNLPDTRRAHRSDPAARYAHVHTRRARLWPPCCAGMPNGGRNRFETQTGRAQHRVHALEHDRARRADVFGRIHAADKEHSSPTRMAWQAAPSGSGTPSATTCARSRLVEATASILTSRSGPRADTPTKQVVGRDRAGTLPGAIGRCPAPRHSP